MTPKTLLLDVMRVAQPRSVAVRDLVRLAEPFGISGNAIRVALTRLLRQGWVETDDRGSYVLAQRADPLRRHVESWRLGEKRRKAWKGDFWAVHMPRGLKTNERKSSVRALGWFGFKAALDGVWVRPNNLVMPLDEASTMLDDLGMCADAVAFRAEFPAEVSDVWCRTLWPITRLTKGYRAASKMLAASSKKISRLSPGEGLVESFMVGGEAIRILATDPLLPEEIQDPAPRQQLTAATIAFDRLGRDVWAKAGHGMPNQPQPMAALRIVDGGSG